MQVPPEIAFRNVAPRDELKRQILDGVEKLEEIYPNLISCRTMVEDTTPKRRSGNDYRVRVEVGIPNHTVVVDKHDPDTTEHREVSQAIVQAFDIARKRLQKQKELQRGDVKTSDLPPHGRVTSLRTSDTGVRYGFIEARDGRQIYFQESALVDMHYGEIEVGDEVRFMEAGGNEGPQASTVASLDTQDIGPVQEKSIPLREEQGS